MKITVTNPLPKPPSIINIELGEDDARLLMTIIGGSLYNATDLRIMYDNNPNKYGSVWDETIGSRLYTHLKPVIQSL